MFVFRKEDIPADPVFPAELEKLGQIRKIVDPAQPFQFKINRNDRWNEVQREAMNACIRDIVYSRLRDLGLGTLRLPLMSGAARPHVPIMVSKNLSSASRIVAVFGEPVQDLGIWAYRTIGGDDGINVGSAVSLAKAVLGDDNGDTALVLANTGQLVWYCGGRKAMTLQSWLALPRPTAADPPMMMSSRNKIPGHHDWQAHVESVFDEVLAARGRLVRKDAKIDIIGLADGGLGVVRYLARNWDSWRPYVSAICLSNPMHDVYLDLPDREENGMRDPSSFSSFVSSRCRAYVLSDQPLGVPVSGFREHGCNCYSSGELLHIECIMPRAWGHMLEWLAMAHDDQGYGEAELEIREVDEGEDDGEAF
ncbi:hypothetical protein HFD88_001835 [Aspergillus terreus]|nr:hypothetical protein HFD88_001835 [Aspergillus terreus]